MSPLLSFRSASRDFPSAERATFCAPELKLVPPQDRAPLTLPMTVSRSRETWPESPSVVVPAVWRMWLSSRVTPVMEQLEGSGVAIACSMNDMWGY